MPIEINILKEFEIIMICKIVVIEILLIMKEFEIPNIYIYKIQII